MEYESFWNRKAYGLVLIAPRRAQVARLVATLDFLAKDSSSQWRDFVTHNMTTILISPRPGWYNEMFVEDGLWYAEARFLSPRAFDNRYLASLLVHEAQHCAQYKASKQYSGEAAEAEAIDLQQKFLNEIGYTHASEWLRHAHEREFWKEQDRNEEAVSVARQFREQYRSGTLNIRSVVSDHRG